MNQTVDYTNLGYENGWYKHPPKEYVECRKAGHKLKGQSDHTTCVHTYVCDTCKITWKIDSGD